VTATAKAAARHSANAALDGLPPGRLQRMSAAAAVALDCQRLLDKTGHNIVGEVLRGEAAFTEWNHYPDGDAYDPETQAQYYYHAHPPDARPFAEHGHFHLFLRQQGMPPGLRPAAGQPIPLKNDQKLSHLIAISMDRYGAPIRLFTTNRWVTGDLWYRADDIIRMLDSFIVDVVRPNLVVNRWLTAMVQLFHPEIAALLAARDRTIAAWQDAHPGGDVFEDRRLDAASALEFSIDGYNARLAAAQGVGGKNVRTGFKPAPTDSATAPLTPP
jgi:hypothetical protein